MDENKKLLKAYSFHSFNRIYPPNLTQDNGLDPAKDVKYIISPNKSSNVSYWYLFPLITMILVLIIVLNNSSEPENLYSPLVISITGFFAFFGVLRTLNVNRQNITESNSISALDSLWIPKRQKISKQNHSYLLEPTDSFHDAINKYRFLQKYIIDNTTPEQGILHASVMGVRLALNNEPFEFIKDKKSVWTNIFKEYGIDKNAIRKGLNEVESLCQGINLGAFDEELVRNRIGADLSAMITYLLPYIYTMREVHAYRLKNRKNFLESIPFADKGEHYTNHNETHDLMYEYAEYYCYKWFYAKKSNIASFDGFHSDLLQVYKQLNNESEKLKDNIEVFPFAYILKKNQNQTLRYLQEIKS